LGRLLRSFYFDVDEEGIVAMRVKISSVVFLFGSVAMGCATSPDGVRQETAAPVSVRIQGTGGGDVYLMSEVSRGTFHLSGTMDEAWSRASALFEELGVEVNYLIPSNHAIGNNQFRVRRVGGARNSRYLECGSGATAVPNADGYEVTGSLITTFKQDEDGTTVMQTSFTASARARELSGGSVACTSKGTLEQHMADVMNEWLGVSAPGE
jgi:hypothetical protein